MKLSPNWRLTTKKRKNYTIWEHFACSTGRATALKAPKIALNDILKHLIQPKTLKLSLKWHLITKKRDKLMDLRAAQRFPVAEQVVQLIGIQYANEGRPCF